MDVERRKVSDVKPFADNARTHSKEQVQQLAASTKEFGWTDAQKRAYVLGDIRDLKKDSIRSSFPMTALPLLQYQGYNVPVEVSFASQNLFAALDHGLNCDFRIPNRASPTR